MDSSATHPETAAFPGRADSVRDARRFVVRTLVTWGVGAAADDAALLTSELATNAVIHARSEYTVAVRRTDRGVRVEVRDGSPAQPSRRRYHSTSGTGRGLGLVEAIAVEWGVLPDGRGKRVWFEVASDSRRSRLDTAGGATDTIDLDAILADIGVEGDTMFAETLAA